MENLIHAYTKEEMQKYAMTTDDILKLAHHAGLTDVLGSWCQECGCTDDMLMHFAGLIVARAERIFIPHDKSDA